MVNYPNGKSYKTAFIPKAPEINYGKRGMTLEADLNETNLYYLEQGIAAIHKKPTPVQIVHVDYPKRSAAVIKEAYFKQASTTDYNGVYKGKYIDFEAKETKNTTSFPLQNFHNHQIEHMQRVVDNGGICFVILRFTELNETYLLEATHLLSYWKRHTDGGRKSITKEEISSLGFIIPQSYHPLLPYIHIIEQLYFLENS